MKDGLQQNQSTPTETMISRGSPFTRRRQQHGITRRVGNTSRVSNRGNLGLHHQRLPRQDQNVRRAHVISRGIKSTRLVRRHVTPNFCHPVVPSVWNHGILLEVNHSWLNSHELTTNATQRPVPLNC